jgi:hypothetical protein
MVSVDVGQADVEHHDIVGLVFGERERSLAQAGGLAGVAILAQGHLNALGHHLVVVDKEYVHGLRVDYPCSKQFGRPHYRNARGVNNLPPNRVWPNSLR